MKPATKPSIGGLATWAADAENIRKEFQAKPKVKNQPAHPCPACEGRRGGFDARKVWQGCEQCHATGKVKRL